VVSTHRDRVTLPAEKDKDQAGEAGSMAAVSR
jgi:hypothetical protein